MKCGWCTAERDSWIKVMNNMELHAHAQQVPNFALKAPGLPITLLANPWVVRRPAQIILNVGLGDMLRKPPKQRGFNGVARLSHREQHAHKNQVE